MSGRTAIPRSRQTNPRRAGLTTNVSEGSAAQLGHGRLDAHVDPAEETLRAERFAPVREGHDDAPPLSHHAGELVLGLGEPTRRDRGPLRLEDVRLRARKRVEACRAVQARMRERLLVPEAHDVVDLPDEIRRAFEERDALVVALVEARLRRRERAPVPGTRQPRQTAWSARWVNGENARTPLDLVAEELHAKRLSPRAREHVHEPAAHRDLPALLDALDALVARERELLHERVEVASRPWTRAG